MQLQHFCYKIKPIQILCEKPYYAANYLIVFQLCQLCDQVLAIKTMKALSHHQRYKIKQ